MVASPTPATIEISLSVFLFVEFCDAIKMDAAAMDMGVLPGTRSKSTALLAENKKRIFKIFYKCLIFLCLGKKLSTIVPMVVAALWISRLNWRFPQNRLIKSPDSIISK